MKSKHVHLYYRYGSWRVVMNDVGRVYDPRHMAKDFLNATYWCNTQNAKAALATNLKNFQQYQD